MSTLIANLSYPTRIAIILAFAAGAHLMVIIVRRLSGRLMTSLPRTSFAKIRSVTSLLTSMIIFVLYFGALGLVLREFGFSLTAYLASASVMGLAIGFGSQGLVQDVVTGLTLIFSDLIDIDDMVEISGQTGIVQAIGMRFVVLKNHLAAEVFIPNRTITNVINYRRGYVRCLVDVRLSSQENVASQMVTKTADIITAAYDQFPGLFITEPSVEGRIKTRTDKEFARFKFRIWPGRGAVLETALKQEIFQSLKTLNPDYADWMVTVSYEVEKKSISIASKKLKAF
jgi:small-conductance mechanosensitive channel